MVNLAVLACVLRTKSIKVVNFFEEKVHSEQIMATPMGQSAGYSEKVRINGDTVWKQRVKVQQQS